MNGYPSTNDDGRNAIPCDVEQRPLNGTLALYAWFSFIDHHSLGPMSSQQE